MLTLEMEVDLIWPAPWNFMKIVYLVQRYLPMFDAFLIVCKHVFLWHCFERCLTWTFIYSPVHASRDELCRVFPELQFHRMYDPFLALSRRLAHCLPFIPLAGLFTVGIALSEGMFSASYYQKLISVDFLNSVVLTVRVWAVWGRDKRLSIGLPVFFVACWVPIFVVMGVFLQSTSGELRTTRYEL